MGPNPPNPYPKDNLQYRLISLLLKTYGLNTTKVILNKNKNGKKKVKGLFLIGSLPPDGQKLIKE